MSEENPYAHVVGHRFPGGTVTTETHRTWLWADAVLAHQDHQHVHPSYLFLMALHGTGADVNEILALVDFRPEEGALAGAYGFEFKAPLRHDVEYRVEGEITAIERKRGKRMGLFDRLTFEISVIDPESDAVAVTHSTVWMLPRKEDANAAG